MKKLTRHPFLYKSTIQLAALYARLVFATSRVQLVQPLPAEATQTPAVFALWHQQLTFAPTLMHQTGRPLLALMSASRDGTAIRHLAAKLGIGAAIGSSHRQAVSGTRGLLRAAKSGHSLMITPDGPRGPAHKAKNGAVEVARLTGLPLIPCAAWSNRGLCFGSWDNLRLPYPFATITLVVGQPLPHATSTSLEHALNTLTAQAQAAAGHLAETASTY